MTEALVALPSHLRKRLAQALDSGILAPPYARAAVDAAVGGALDGDAVARALGELHGLGVSGPGCAAWLRGFDQLTSRRTAPDFVWSGPEVAGLHARDTRRVYEELLGSASHSAWVTTYAFFDGPACLRGAGPPDGRDTGALGHPAAERAAQEGRFDRRGPSGSAVRGSLLDRGVAGISPPSGLLRPALARIRKAERGFSTPRQLWSTTRPSS